MNWLEMTDKEILGIANPIMDNLMEASTKINHEMHVRDFSDRLKGIVTKENLQEQCKEYQKELGYFSTRELVGIFKKEKDVRVFWKQWFTKSKNEFLQGFHNQIKAKLEKLVPQEILQWCLINAKVLIGKPGEELVKYAAANDVNLIVLGTRVHRKAKKPSKKSITYIVSQRSTCPILSVRQNPPD